MYSSATTIISRMANSFPGKLFPAGGGDLMPIHQFAEALGQVVDIKDKYTHAHSMEVAEIGYLLAYHLGLDGNGCDAVHVAGHLHDLGKIGIADRILQKAGPLDPEERREIERHPVIGHEIIRHIDALRRPGGIAAMVLHHHEKYDGSGYPGGLRGEQIPAGARILAVADAVSAMTGARNYRPAKGWEEVREEVVRNAGRHFDPEVAAAFLAIEATVRDLLVPESKPQQRGSLCVSR